MKFVVDVNLSLGWKLVLEAEGWDAVHWSEVGDLRATDAEIMGWAESEQRIVLTHDLDFGALLAVAAAKGPSVVQVRTQEVRPQKLGPLVVALLRDYEKDLMAGALLVVEVAKSRLRLLPLNRNT